MCLVRPPKLLRISLRRSSLASVTALHNIGMLQASKSMRLVDDITSSRTRADTSGNFVSPYMKPGTYTMTRKSIRLSLNAISPSILIRCYVVYKVELAVATQSVTVSAGGTVTSNIASTESVSLVGLWDLGYSGSRLILCSEPHCHLADRRF